MNTGLKPLCYYIDDTDKLTRNIITKIIISNNDDLQKYIANLAKTLLVATNSEDGSLFYRKTIVYDSSITKEN